MNEIPAPGGPLAIRRALAMLASAYPRQRETLASAETASAWTLCLGDIPEDMLRLAVARITRASAWPPSAAECRMECLRLIGYAPPSGEEAYDEARRWYRSYWLTMERRPWSHEMVERAALLTFGKPWARPASGGGGEPSAEPERFLFSYKDLRARAERELLASAWSTAQVYIEKRKILERPGFPELDEYNRAAEPRRLATGDHP